jgi:hypothetical protein
LPLVSSFCARRGLCVVGSVSNGTFCIFLT